MATDNDGKGLLGALGELGKDVVDAAGHAIDKVGDLIHGAEERIDPDFGFDYDFIAPLGMQKALPLSQLPDAEWLVQVGVVAVDILANSHKSKEVEETDDEHIVARLAKRKRTGKEPDVAATLRSQAQALSGTEEHREWVKQLFESIRPERGDTQPPATLDDYDALFQTIDLPPIAQSFQHDDTFARLRVAGPNPTSIERVRDALPTAFPVSEATYSAVVPGDSLSSAIAEKRLYLLNYGGLQPTLNGTYPGRQKYAFEPFALFAVPPGASSLVPVAIQCGQDPSQHTIVVPTDGPKWQLAKTIVQVADGNFHELVAHLGRTHLVVEPFVVVTHTALDADHPVRVLLTPHFEGTIFINWAAGDFLVAKENVVDQLLSGTIDADRTAGVRITASRGFNASFLPEWLAAQGLDDADALPDYPFRDDALLVWDAILEWMTAYVGVYWPDDDAIAADTALQGWAQQAASFSGGRVADFGEQPDGSIVTPGYLAKALTMIVFTGSAMHAAVNFPQGDIMVYAPAVPLAGYLPETTVEGPVDHETWLSFLPGLSQAKAQLNTLHLLGSVYHTVLGQYPDGTFSNPDVENALASFQNRLSKIEQTIAQRNRERVPYKYLMPSAIPQSINI